jgi:hypothetical protein
MTCAPLMIRDRIFTVPIPLVFNALCTAIELRTDYGLAIMQTNVSVAVIDVMTGKALSSLRFPNIPAALDFLSDAIIMCSSCGVAFEHSSVRNIVNRGNGWEISFPHECRPASSKKR